MTQSASKNRAAAVRLLKAMGNAHRLDILCTLKHGELSVSALCNRINLSQSAMSQHLAWLRNERLVSSRRASQSVLYRLSDTRAAEMITLLNRLYGSVDENN